MGVNVFRIVQVSFNCCGCFGDNTRVFLDRLDKGDGPLTGGAQLTEDSSNRICRACKRKGATYLCEDCGAVLCSNCLETKFTSSYVCKDCHSILGTPLPGQRFEECSDCGSENLSVGRRIEEICPECHSTHTILVDAKQRSIAQELRQAINSLQYGHIKLREFNNRLVGGKRLLVSLRMANFLHYRWLDDKIQSIQEELPAIKNRIGSQADMLARQIAAETKGLMNTTTWSTSQFPFIEGVTNRVTQLVNQYKHSVDEALSEANLTLNDIVKQLDGLNYYRSQFSSFYEHAELSINELPVCALPKIKVTGSDFLKHDKATGTLFITNRRLVFIAQRGVVRKKTEIIFDFPLLYLTSMEEDGRFRKRMVLKMKQGEVKISCSEQTKKVLPDYVEIAKKFDRYMQTDLQKVRKLEQTSVNVSDVRLRIEDLIYSLNTGGNRPRTSMTYPNPPIGAYYAEPSSPQSRYPCNDYGRYHQGAQFKDHLERTIDRGAYRQYPDARGEMAAGIETLRRNASSLDNAIRDTVHLFRGGRLVPEDFIRRYKGLMRDSYYTRKEIERMSSRDAGYYR